MLAWLTKKEGAGFLAAREVAGLKEFSIFVYSTEHLPKKDKVRFYYGLKGRDGKSGIVNKYSLNPLGKAVLLVPKPAADDVSLFLRGWKCKFDRLKVWVE